MVGVPQRAAVQRLQSPRTQQRQAGAAALAPDLVVCRDCVSSATGADALIAGKRLIAKKRRVSSQPPFVHAEVRTECLPPARDFEAAPPAEIAAVLALRQVNGAADIAALQRAV